MASNQGRFRGHWYLKCVHNEFVEEHEDSDGSDLSNTGDSSNSDFHDQKGDLLLFDTGDDSDVGNGAYMIDTHFLWEDMGNYEGNSISKLQIVIEKNWMEIMTYKQHLFFNIISIQI